MATTVVESGSSGTIATAFIIILTYGLSLYHITLPSDVIAAITSIVYFVGHMTLNTALPPAAAPEPPAAGKP
jgi:hypothetical protein